MTKPAHRRYMIYKVEGSDTVVDLSKFQSMTVEGYVLDIRFEGGDHIEVEYADGEGSKKAFTALQIFLETFAV